LHFGLSLLVACLAAALVFGLWYPTPYREISGGRELFLLIVAVDVVTGPVITFAVFDRRKAKRELMRDLAFVVGLQLAALAYGLHTVAQARPAVVALEGDRLRVVRAIDLAEANFTKAPPGLQSLSWWGPTLVAARPPSREEAFDAMQRGLAGEDIGMRPEFWRPPGDTAAAFARAAKPVQTLLASQPRGIDALQQTAVGSGVPLEHLGYLPILARRTDWSALVDRRSGALVGYAPVDGF
jgi:hypothetical protein